MVHRLLHDAPPVSVLAKRVLAHHRMAPEELVHVRGHVALAPHRLPVEADRHAPALVLETPQEAPLPVLGQELRDGADAVPHPQAVLLNVLKMPGHAVGPVEPLGRLLLLLHLRDLIAGLVGVQRVLELVEGPRALGDRGEGRNHKVRRRLHPSLPPLPGLLRPRQLLSVVLVLHPLEVGEHAGGRGEVARPALPLGRRWHGGRPGLPLNTPNHGESATPAFELLPFCEDLLE
mmetsp:Transcript_21215/g.67151  ORF Transcript_21215/g.67151 Transcript_21215/m.67151 type:complete len:233 (+) Transcript_21215:264-962(+)